MAVALVIVGAIDVCLVMRAVQYAGAFSFETLTGLGSAFNAAALMVAYLHRFQQHEELKRRAKEAEGKSTKTA